MVDFYSRRFMFCVSFVLCCLPLLQSCATDAQAAGAGTVYICTGPKAKVYHSTSKCKGLSKCSGEIKKISRSSTDRRGCRMCVK